MVTRSPAPWAPRGAFCEFDAVRGHIRPYLRRSIIKPCAFALIGKRTITNNFFCLLEIGNFVATWANTRGRDVSLNSRKCPDESDGAIVVGRRVFTVSGEPRVAVAFGNEISGFQGRRKQMEIAIAAEKRASRGERGVRKTGVRVIESLTPITQQYTPFAVELARCPAYLIGNKSPRSCIRVDARYVRARARARERERKRERSESSTNFTPVPVRRTNTKSRSPRNRGINIQIKCSAPTFISYCRESGRKGAEERGGEGELEDWCTHIILHSRARRSALDYLLTSSPNHSLVSMRVPSHPCPALPRFPFRLPRVPRLRDTRRPRRTWPENGLRAHLNAENNAVERNRRGVARPPSLSDNFSGRPARGTRANVKRAEPGDPSREGEKRLGLLPFFLFTGAKRARVRRRKLRRSRIITRKMACRAAPE